MILPSPFPRSTGAVKLSRLLGCPLLPSCGRSSAPFCLGVHAGGSTLDDQVVGRHGLLIKYRALNVFSATPNQETNLISRAMAALESCHLHEPLGSYPGGGHWWGGGKGSSLPLDTAYWTYIGYRYIGYD
jgi:hypothetical protein